MLEKFRYFAQRRFLQPVRCVLIDDGLNGLSGRAIGAAIRVHKKYGPGLLEKAYRVPYVAELEGEGLQVACETALPIEHGGKRVPRAYIIDLLVEGKLIIEIKAVAKISPVHVAQLRAQLRLSGIAVGLLINFNVPILRHGIRRVLNAAG